MSVDKQLIRHLLEPLSAELWPYFVMIALACASFQLLVHVAMGAKGRELAWRAWFEITAALAASLVLFMLQCMLWFVLKCMLLF